MRPRDYLTVIQERPLKIAASTTLAATSTPCLSICRLTINQIMYLSMLVAPPG